MNNNNGKIEIPYAAWDVEASCSQGMIEEMQAIKELCYQQHMRGAGLAL